MVVKNHLFESRNYEKAADNQLGWSLDSGMRITGEITDKGFLFTEECNRYIGRADHY
jgi:hypothetical protein